MKEPLISIITATYNRASTLPELKASIEAQTYKDFEWIVVDDGSTDATQALLQKWLKEGCLELIVFRQRNGGKHRALNRAIANARGRWVYIVDSDDRLPPLALEIISSNARLVQNADNVAGLIGLKADFDGNIVGERLPEKVQYADALSLTYRYGIRGDKAEVFKTAILKRFPFPEIEGENFLTEATVWYRIARAGYTLRIVNEVLYEACYRADGLSARSLQLKVQNIRGTLMFYREEIEGGLPFPGMLRESANYLRYFLHARESGKADRLPDLPWQARVYVYAAFLPALCAYVRDRQILKKNGSSINRRMHTASGKNAIRVLHVINSLAFGGAERLLADLLPILQQNGVQNHVLVLDGRRCVFAENLIGAGIPVHFARTAPRRQNASSPYSPLHIVSVLKAIRRVNPHIVHAHLAPSFHWCAIASLFEKSPSFVTTEHASENRRMRIPLMKGIEKFLYSRYNKILCVSQAAAESLGAWLALDTSKIIVAPNGVALERFGLQIPPAPDVVQALQGRTGVAMIARFVPVKDHRTAIAALSFLPDRYAMVFIGDGPELPQMQKYAETLGVGRRCLFLGARMDVPEILHACQMYVQTSIKEGFGIAVLEAMASGLPVAASDTSGLSGLVEGSGLLFPQGDARKAAHALLQFEDPETRAQAISSAYKKIQRYTLAGTAEIYYDCYKNLRK